MRMLFSFVPVIMSGIAIINLAMAVEPDPSPGQTNGSSASAVLGGGCFWCLDAAFEQLPGVTKVTSGFAGGAVPNPSYEQVCSGTTGHAEVIRVNYDPSKVSYDKILELFWKVHDPTTLNRQGADVGTQYRSIILTESPEQAVQAEASKKNAQALYPVPIVTEIVPLKAFYPAEDYHQDYYKNNKGRNPYCQVVIAAKLKKLGLKQ